MSNKTHRVSINLAILAFTLIPHSSQAAPPPTRVGQCSETFVALVRARLFNGVTGESIAGSGTSIQFTNGVYLHSHNNIATADASKPSDKVKMCLNSVPKNCPPGDNRGKFYKVVNYRTRGSFTMRDSNDPCG